MKHNTLVVHDTEYSMTRAYKEGARAFRQSVPWSCNPYRDGSQSHFDWDSGHTHDAAGEHYRFGVDVIEEPNTSHRFEMDAKVPRDANGDVDDAWLAEQVRQNKAPARACVAA